MQCKPFKVSVEKNVWLFCDELIPTWFVKQNYRIISLSLTCLFVYFTLNDLGFRPYSVFATSSYASSFSLYIQMCVWVCFLIVTILDSGNFYQHPSRIPIIFFLSFLPAPKARRNSDCNKKEDHVEHLN